MHRRGGNVAYISHSGSGMCGIVDSEERIDFNLVVSTGQEVAVSMDEYLDYALEMPSTRAVGLFMETARNPDGLVRAFDKARRRGIPIVALKVGRTDFSVRPTVSHWGRSRGAMRYTTRSSTAMESIARATWTSLRPHSSCSRSRTR